MSVPLEPSVFFFSFQICIDLIHGLFKAKLTEIRQNEGKLWQLKPQTAHQQFGVQYLAPGHFEMQLGGAGIRPALAPELQLPQYHFFHVIYIHILHFSAFIRHFCPKRRTVVYTLMAEAATQGANQHIRFWVSVLG